MSQLARAQLSALAAGIDDAATRVVELAQRLEGADEAEAVAALYEAERTLAMAGRALARAGTALDR